MRDAWGKIGKVVCDKRVSLPGEVERTAARAYEVDLFLARVGDGLAFAAGRDRELAEAGDTERVAGFGVPLAKKRQVAAGACREIGLLFAGGGEVAP